MPKVLEDQAERDGRLEWAAELRRHMEYKSMNRQRLAAAIGVSRAQLDKYAEGAVTPPGKYLGKFADVLDFDTFEQLSLLRWVGARDARVARERRISRTRAQIHASLQSLIALDAEVSGARPALAVVDPLLKDGWAVRHWVDWRGARRRLSYLDILELEPPVRLHYLDSEALLVNSLKDVPAVDRAAWVGLTEGELRLRKVAEDVIGSDLFNIHECYWSERARHHGAYRSHPPAKRPGLVMAVPWLLRRRFPREGARFVAQAGVYDDGEPTSMVVLGLPYSGAPDVAAVLADEILRWGLAGVAMLTRERWHEVDVSRRVDRESETAVGLASGLDPRIDRTVWFYNQPEAIPASVRRLVDAPNPPVVVHLRFTDSALRDFLLTEWGGTPGRRLSDLTSWRGACDRAERDYANRYPGRWLTVDVDLSRDLVGYNGEDARSDLYVVDLVAQVEEWLGARFGLRRNVLWDDERELLDVLGRRAGGVNSPTDVAVALSITKPAAKLLVERVMSRHGLHTAEDLQAFADWHSEKSRTERSEDW